MRRGLGFKLYDAGIGLLDFVAFMERKHAPRITTKLALEWAQKPKTVLPSEWARRLSFVRGFAHYLSAIDPRTEIPPAALLPYRPQRARPYIYTNQEIEWLLAAARSLPPAGGLRGWKYHCLLGLLELRAAGLGCTTSGIIPASRLFRQRARKGWISWRIASSWVHDWRNN
jgi:hypothetical protein